MGQYKELVYHLPEEREVMEELTTITDNFVETVRLTHPQKYNNFIEQVKKLHTSHHFTKETLEEAHKHVEPHYTIEHTNKVAREEFDITFSKEPFNEYDFNFVMNEKYKIYCSVYGDNTNTYAELALAWLDHNHGKAMKYYQKVYKNE